MGANLGLLYLKSPECRGLFFNRLLIKVCSEEGLVAVAAVTLDCRGGAQTKMSLEHVGCPPLDPEPHQHL